VSDLAEVVCSNITRKTQQMKTDIYKYCFFRKMLEHRFIHSNPATLEYGKANDYRVKRGW